MSQSQAPLIQLDRHIWEGTKFFRLCSQVNSQPSFSHAPLSKYHPVLWHVQPSIQISGSDYQRRFRIERRPVCQHVTIATCNPLPHSILSFHFPSHGASALLRPLSRPHSHIIVPTATSRFPWPFLTLLVLRKQYPHVQLYAG